MGGYKIRFKTTRIAIAIRAVATISKGVIPEEHEGAKKLPILSLFASLRLCENSFNRALIQP
jgi:hypothetical protein